MSLAPEDEGFDAEVYSPDDLGDAYLPPPTHVYAPDSTTVCTLCGVVDPIRASGDKARPAGPFGVCSKGVAFPRVNQAEAPHRTERHLCRVGGRWRAVPARDALHFVAWNLLRIRGEHGRGRLAVYGAGQMTLESLWLSKKLFQGVLGTNSVGSNAEQCLAANAGGHELIFGNEGPMAAYADIAEAEAIFLYGSNMAINHPTIYYGGVSRNRSAFKAVTDPRVTATAEGIESQGGWHLQLRSGGDPLLNLAIARVILDNGWQDQAYLDEFVDPDSLKAFRTLLAEPRFTAAAAARELSMPGADPALLAERIEKLAWHWAHQRVVTISSVGINQTTGAHGIATILNLHLLTGNIGEPGRGHVRVAGQANAPAELAMGYNSALLPFRMRVDDPRGRTEAERFWGLPQGAINPQPGVPVGRYVEDDGPLFLLCFGTHFSRNFPDLKRWLARLRDDVFVVVADPYASPEVYDFADVVIPAASHSEVNGTYLNGERAVQPLRAQGRGPACALSDTHIICQLAEALWRTLEEMPEDLRQKNADIPVHVLRNGFNYQHDFGWEPRHDLIYGEIVEASIGKYNQLLDGEGERITADRLNKEANLQWGGVRRYRREDGLFPGAFLDQRHRAKLSIPPPRHQRPLKPTGRGFQLVTGRGWPGSRYRGRNTALFNSCLKSGWDVIPDENPLFVHPQDATRLGLSEDGYARLRSSRGELVVKVTLSEKVAIGYPYLTFHPDRAGTNPNVLTDASLRCPVTQQPQLKDLPVSIEPAAVSARVYPSEDAQARWPARPDLSVDESPMRRTRLYHRWWEGEQGAIDRVFVAVERILPGPEDGGRLARGLRGLRSRLSGLRRR